MTEGQVSRHVTIGQALLATTLGYTVREIGARTGLDHTTLHNSLHEMMVLRPPLVEREALEPPHEAKQGKYRYRLTEFARGRSAA